MQNEILTEDLDFLIIDWQMESTHGAPHETAGLSNYLTAQRGETTYWMSYSTIK